MNDLPPADHVSRHCPKARFADGQVQASAFIRRDSEPALSVNWLQNTGKAVRQEQLRVIVGELRTRRKISNESYLAVLEVGAAIDRVRNGTNPVVVLTAIHVPTQGIPTHARLQGMEINDQMVAEILAEVSRSETPHLVADIAPA